MNACQALCFLWQLTKQTLKNDFEEEQRKKLLQINTAKSTLAFGIGCLYLALGLLTKSLNINKSFDQIRADKEARIEIYNWERSERIFPFFQVVGIALICSMYFLLLGQLCFPWMAKLNVLFFTALSILMSPFSMITSEVESKVWLNGLISLYTVIFLQTNFHVSLIALMLLILGD